jgi:phosphoesterase RecJ-like protein
MEQGFAIMWDDIVRFIQDKNSFLLSTHVHPEGDAIGSEVALKAYLEKLGKKVVIVNSDATPRNCRFLDPDNEIITYPDNYSPDIMDGIDGVIILDVNNWMHLGRFGEVLRKSPKPRACIDHHEGLHDHFAEVAVSDTSAASAGVLVYDLIKHMGGTITSKIANAVYASLITDTGTFRFSNTDARAFTIAADLCTKGVEPFKLHRAIFANKSWGAAQLIGPVLNTLRSTADGRLAWICMTRQMLEDANAEYEDSDSLLGLVRAIKGVECCLFFKETKEGSIKVSVRSNGKVNAHEIARAHDGGGHRMAAGMNISGSMEEAVELVVKHCLKLDVLKS